MAPAPPVPRRGRQSARRFAAACYQDDSNIEWYRGVAKAFGNEAAFSDPPFSEDCLYLNVWTPSLNRRASLPVLVWIHGGGNSAGWSFESDYDGANLAARGQVVVSMAYRLGIFGFFGHPDLRGTGAGANFGLLDQIAALRWIKDHIGAFGGDRHNVTIAGESAGGADVGYLIASAPAQGLFRRAISESGGYQMLDASKLADAERVGLALAAALPGHPGLAALRRRSSAEILAAAKRALPDQTFGPVADGVSLEQTPASFYRRSGVSVDLLIGTNQNEWYMYVNDEPSSLTKTLKEWPAHVRETLADRAAGEPDVKHGNDVVSSLVNMQCSAYAMAASAAGPGRQVWVYRFTRVREGPGGQALLSYHGAEIPYVFDTHDDWLPTDEIDRGLTSAMLGYWTNFARTGNPNGADLPPWPAFDAAHSRIQELGSFIGPRDAPDKALCDRIAGDIYPGW
jgi:para-nitrobenzyl esterase